MANNKHLEIIMQGVEKWNYWRRNNPAMPDLSKAILNRVNLRAANLSETNLTKADLRGAHISHADLFKADLRFANLNDAELVITDLTAANLTEANLNGALLNGATLTEAILTGTNFAEARISYTTFGDNDLSLAKGLDAVIQYGPSTIGIDTIYKSRGLIPSDFLLGAGVPENFITYMSSLTGNVFDFYSCFISYSSKNQSFVERLRFDLHSKGVRCWFAPEDLKIGDRIRVGIDESIRKHDKLLLVLSKHSVASEWVEKEVEAAMEQEQIQKRTILFPIRLDDTVMRIENGWPADIRRTRNIGDFQRWRKPDFYEKAFDRLLRDLEREGCTSRRA